MKDGSQAQYLHGQSCKHQSGAGKLHLGTDPLPSNESQPLNSLKLQKIHLKEADSIIRFEYLLP